MYGKSLQHLKKLGLHHAASLQFYQNIRRQILADNTLIVAFENRISHKSKGLPRWCLHGYLKVLCDYSAFIYSVKQSKTALP
jgi:hypothetical protein